MNLRCSLTLTLTSCDKLIAKTTAKGVSKLNQMTKPPLTKELQGIADEISKLKKEANEFVAKRIKLKENITATEYEGEAVGGLDKYGLKVRDYMSKIEKLQNEYYEKYHKLMENK